MPARSDVLDTASLQVAPFVRVFGGVFDLCTALTKAQICKVLALATTNKPGAQVRYWRQLGWGMATRIHQPCATPSAHRLWGMLAWCHDLQGGCKRRTYLRR